MLLTICMEHSTETSQFMKGYYCLGASEILPEFPQLVQMVLAISARTEAPEKNEEEAWKRRFDLAAQ